MPASEATISVNLANQPYAITVRPGLLREAGAMIRSLSKAAKAAVVTDTDVEPHHGGTLVASLREAGFDVLLARVPAGEDQKHLGTIDALYGRFLSARIDRSTPIIALGGGVVGDMAGFVAATILRGVPLVQIPTSLLAMVDASVGGKTGVNHEVGKNLIGAFHQPIAVLIDPETLRTLPEAELRGGLAECIKHDIIRDADGFARLEKNIDRALALDIDYLAELVAHNVAIKAKVVESDPFEHGERAHLNFGHTFGHAIETVSEYSYSHGQCVAFGMAAAAFAASRLGMIDEPTRLRIVTLIERAGLPTTGLELSTADIVNSMAYDKKVKSGKLRFILPDRIGHVVIRDDVPVDLVFEAVQSLSE